MLSVLPPGPISSFPGQDTNAIADQINSPGLAADVSPFQNAELTGGPVNGGLFVWSKPALPISTPPTATKTPLSTFWCGSVTGRTLPGCNPLPTAASAFQDMQLGYDSSIGLWIAVQVAPVNPSTGSSQVFLAVSTTDDATGSWNEWAIPACTSNPKYPSLDQPLLGWSNAFIVIDVTCFTPPVNGMGQLGPDEVFVMPYQASGTGTSTITASSFVIGPKVAPCSRMTPSRDEQGNFANAYLLASILPQANDAYQFNDQDCARTSDNTLTSVVEYNLLYKKPAKGSITASNPGTAEVDGKTKAGGKCLDTPLSSSCLPISTSPQWGAADAMNSMGKADQLGCGGQPGCFITLNGSRISTAQIRPTIISGKSTPILVGAFGTGIATDSIPNPNQILYFVQDPFKHRWLSHLSAPSSSGSWYDDPTIAIGENQNYYLGTTVFSSTTYPATGWLAFSGLQKPKLEGAGITEQSTNEYTGNGPGITERWDDYNAMIYDPHALAGGFPSWWSVEEVSQGGTKPNPYADQSTNWWALANPSPMPYFVGYDVPVGTPGNTPGSNPCSGVAGQLCQIVFSAPANSQPGDVFIADVTGGGDVNTNYLQLPSGWSTMPIHNRGEAQYLVSSGRFSNTTEDLYATSFLVAHVYSNGDPGTYTFGLTQKRSIDHLGGFLVSYRGANTDLLLGYTAYGSSFLIDDPSSNKVVSFQKPLKPPAQTTLLYLFMGNCWYTEGSEGNGGGPWPFSAPAGAPKLSPRTPLTLGTWPFLAADVTVPVGGVTYGGYSSKVCSDTYGGFDHAFALSIPPL